MSRDMGDLDRRKHDVDVIERVLGGVRDRLTDDEPPTHVVDVSEGPYHSVVELTLGIADDRPRPRCTSTNPDRRHFRRRS